MFLERKFLSPTEPRTGTATGVRSDVLERVRDVVRDVERMLATERGVGHVLPDYGLSRSGPWSVEGILERAAAELRESLHRYEARLVLDEIETEVDDDGHPLVLVLGRIAGERGEREDREERVTLVIDPLRRRVRDVHVG